MLEEIQCILNHRKRINLGSSWVLFSCMSYVLVLNSLRFLINLVYLSKKENDKFEKKIEYQPIFGTHGSIILISFGSKSEPAQ